MGDLSDFRRGHIVGACVAGTSVTKMTTLFGVSTTAVSTVMRAYTSGLPRGGFGVFEPT